ncbi:hypothetical protein N9W17_05640 [Jannaschia sp.]|nr:hypothetical protein [Jannaschia sp.]
MMQVIRLATTASIVVGTQAMAQDVATQTSTLQRMMFYRSFVQDDPACRLVVEDGVPTFTGEMAALAPAFCPDAYAWADLATIVSKSFWNWGTDQTVWPDEPLPLCTTEGAVPCCDPDAAIDPAAPSLQCPVYRADYDPVPPLPAKPAALPNGSVINHRGLSRLESLDPGRLLRDIELEIVFRDKAMVDYLYRHDLYTREGLGARNRAQNAALDRGDIGAAHGFEVRLPVGATMVKGDFLHQDIMQARGLIRTVDNAGLPLDPPNHPEHPYLTVRIDGTGAEGEVPGLYYLVAMTNASRVLPVWHWYVVEHVANQGRCDYIGCNDSFGFSVPGGGQAGADYGPGYIPPHITANDVRQENNETLFDIGLTYPPEETGEIRTPALTALFAGMGIGTAEVDGDPDRITADDPAWLSYRMKGTQTAFTTAGGVPTGMGATVTEGGFVNSASCVTCHAEASVDAGGAAGMQGVGATWRPNLMGYNQVRMGAPDPGAFYTNDGPKVTATQIDFIWGILGASCARPTPDGEGCESYPDAPTIVRAPD